MKKYQVARSSLNIGYKRHRGSARLMTAQELGADGDEALELYVARGDLVMHEVESEEVKTVYDLNLETIKTHAAEDAATQPVASSDVPATPAGETVTEPPAEAVETAPQVTLASTRASKRAQRSEA